MAGFSISCDEFSASAIKLLVSSYLITEFCQLGSWLHIAAVILPFRLILISLGLNYILVSYAVG
jgi:hypothetical protein